MALLYHSSFYMGEATKVGSEWVGVGDITCSIPAVYGLDATDTAVGQYMILLTSPTADTNDAVLTKCIITEVVPPVDPDTEYTISFVKADDTVDTIVSIPSQIVQITTAYDNGMLFYPIYSAASPSTYIHSLNAAHFSPVQLATTADLETSFRELFKAGLLTS